MRREMGWFCHSYTAITTYGCNSAPSHTGYRIAGNFSKEKTFANWQKWRKLSWNSLTNLHGCGHWHSACACVPRPKKFVEKTFVALHKSAKFVKVFSFESFPLYGIHLYSVLDLAKKLRETSPQWLYTMGNEFICTYMETLGQNRRPMLSVLIRRGDGEQLSGKTRCKCFGSVGDCFVVLCQFRDMWT